MSRIGKRPIPIPRGVEIKLVDRQLTVKGPKGALRREIHPDVHVDIDGGRILLSVSEGKRELKAIHGLFRVLIDNMVTGVTKGFEKVLEIVGVGYRAELKGREAIFSLGYSHPINFRLPDGIDAKIEKTRVTLSGIDKELLSMTAAKIRSFREPEPYKGKGLKYADEMIRKKAGKTGVK